MIAANPPLVLNSSPNTTSDHQQQIQPNYNSLSYPSYGSNSTNTNTSSTGGSLYPYNLPAQPDNSRYWSTSSNTLANNTNKRQDNVKR